MTEGQPSESGHADVHVPAISADRRLAGKVAIVTGGGSQGELAGTGVAIAVLFAAKGAHVVIVDRDESRARNTERLIDREGGVAIVHVCDITQPAACEEAAAAAVSGFGRLDILVNNAAILPADERWSDVLELNLHAAKLMIDAVVPQMAKQGGGSIVNIASHAGLRAGVQAPYTAAKGGLIALTKTMAYEHGRAGIRINNIAPGHIHTPMASGFTGYDDELNGARRLRAAAGLLNTEGTAWDVAYASLFLTSDEARWITAATLPVDAGTTEVMPLVMYPQLAAAASERR